jgi:hypothetical protein
MIYGNNKNKLNGYPSPLATNEEKAQKEYGLEYFKTMYYEWHNNGDVILEIEKCDIIAIDLTLKEIKM